MKNPYQVIVMGVSAGGLSVLRDMLLNLPSTMPVSIVIVQHMRADSENRLVEILDKALRIPVKEVEDKECIEPSKIYIAPPGYHLLIEPDHTFTLASCLKTHQKCPSIDALFESAADTYGKELIGVLLTGANEDGAEGLREIQEQGGLVVVQDPSTAEFSTMPAAGLALTHTEHVLPLKDIALFLQETCHHE